MCAASLFKRVVNIPHSSCLVVGGVMSGAFISWGSNDRKSKTIPAPISKMLLAKMARFGCGWFHLVFLF